MSDKLHLNDLVDGLPVVMADGRQATVTVSRNKIVFSIGIGFIRPVIGEDGCVTNAARLTSTKLSASDHDGVLISVGSIRASDIQAATVVDTYFTMTSNVEVDHVDHERFKEWLAAPVRRHTFTRFNGSPDESDAYDGIKTLQALVHKTATDAGWYVDPATGETVERNFGEVVALMHSELSEALEADRKDAMDDKLPHRPGTEVEFADCIIRILDTAAALGLDVAGAIIEKNRFNRDRADHKLANRNAEGGKKY